jgi:hypothetical protein
MARCLFWTVGLGVWLLTPTSLLAAEPLTTGKEPAKLSAAEARDVAALAAKIDKYFAGRWADAKVTAVAQTDDAEFVRRVYLDLFGRIPSVHEARTFLDDKTADKRSRLVNRLLESPGFASHFANVYRGLWLSESNTTFLGAYIKPGFEAWLREEFAKNTPYDKMVRQILTEKIGPETVNGIFGGQTQPSPGGFYVSKQVKPENLAAGTARLFLGVRLECAQCHDHPFATWKREQFWGMAAFFAGIQRQDQGDFVYPTREIADRREIAMSGGDHVIQASFLDGTEPKWKYKAGARVTLADWVTSADNPYFARAAVNRLWAYYFGYGLVEPVDDLVGKETKSYHPALLDEVARDFAAHKFDLRYLMRALTASHVYQLTSASSSKIDPHLFAHMAVKGLSPEQLFDSLVMAIGYQEQKVDPRFIFFDNSGSPRAQFLEKFANRHDNASEVQTSILQALALMNGKFIDDATSLERSEMLAAVTDSPFMDTAQRIEALYLGTISRKPRPQELERLVRYVDQSSKKDVPAQVLANALSGFVGTTTKKKTDKALADVLWALLNSSEFILNH